MQSIEIPRRTPADVRLLWLLGIWWAINLVQAACTGLANDEAYYWIFARDLAWGYFDHPPLTALLVRAGDWLGGAAGIRIFFTLLQPVYLYIIWKLIRPERATLRDAHLWFVLCAAIPILELYGFLAVPDGPLMLTSALFLWAFARWSERDSVGRALLMGLSIGLMAYAKYHGALVVLFAFLGNLRLLRRRSFYLAAVVAAAAIAPHLWWQYRHDWISLRYHLAGRNGFFSWHDVAEFLLNVLAVFNPLFWPLYLRGWRARYAATPVERAMRTIAAGLLVFFTLSSLRGYVQPQWVIVAAFGLAAVLFGYVRERERARRYVLRAGWVTIGLVLVVRFVMVFNPIGLRFEIFDNRESYGAIARVADGRPVIFGGSYAVAAKYIYYTGGEGFSQPSINYRTSQWALRGDDDRFIGREVLVEAVPERADSVIDLANGRRFGWIVVRDFRPVRRIDARIEGGLPAEARAGDTLRLDVTLTNPYPYPVRIAPDSLPLEFVWGIRKHRFAETALPVEVTLPAGGSERIFTTFVLPDSLPAATYRTGLVVRPEVQDYWYAGREYTTRITERE